MVFIEIRSFAFGAFGEERFDVGGFSCLYIFRKWLVENIRYILKYFVLC